MQERLKQKAGDLLSAWLCCSLDSTFGLNREDTFALVEKIKSLYFLSLPFYFCIPPPFFFLLLSLLLLLPFWFIFLLRGFLSSLCLFFPQIFFLFSPCRTFVELTHKADKVENYFWAHFLEFNCFCLAAPLNILPMLDLLPLPLVAWSSQPSSLTLLVLPEIKRMF